MAQSYKQQIYNLNITAKWGDDLVVPIGWRDGNEEYVDFTGCTAFCQLKKNKTSTTINGTLTVDLTGTKTFPNIILRATHQEMMAIGVGLYYFDVQITHPNGFVRTYIEGKFKLTQDVSR